MNEKHLQGIGKYPVIKANDLKVGDITIWNYGYKEKIINIEETKSGKSLVLKILSIDSNKEIVRTIRKESLVCLA